MSFQFSFSGHETFPLRFNWLKKTVDAVSENAHIFGSDEAIAKLGVGKNMVRSMRYWGLATGILKPQIDRKRRSPLRVSTFGAYMLGEDGVDPYCEDSATHWLLHWLLCRSPRSTTLWHFVFGHWHQHALDLQNLQPALKKWLDERKGSMPSEATLRRDLQCLLNTYVTKRSKMKHLENMVACPLHSLGLVYENKGMVYLRESRNNSLPPEIFAYAVLDYWDRNFSETNTLSVQDVLKRRASPGKIFLLSEGQAFDIVSRIKDLDNPPFYYETTADLHQFYRSPEATPKAMLDHYYSRVLLS